MLQTKTLGKKSLVFATIGLFTFLVANVQIANTAESSCVTCHLDKEMLKNNITAQTGATSAMQSGAG
jgi:hypothetical protein